MIKIYFNQKPLFITSTIDRDLDLYYGKDGTAYSDKGDADSVREIVNALRHQDLLAAIICYPDVEHVLSLVKQQFTEVKAAGGLVYNPLSGFLFIFRRGKWDLPKGKLDEGEELGECALREVEEETGAKGLQLKQALLTTYHNYMEGNADILKETHWFLIETRVTGELHPQVNEDIEECVWVLPDGIDQYLKNTHPSVIDVIDKGMSSLNI